MWFLVVFDMPHKMVSRISAQTKMWPVKNPKNSRERAKNVRARHFWAKRASNRSENRIIVISAIFPFREVSTWPTFLKLIFLLRKRFQFFLLGYHGYKGQSVSILSVHVPQNFQHDVAWNPYVRFGWFFNTSYKIDSSCYWQSLKT